LIPVLREKLNEVDSQKLTQAEDGFLTVELDHRQRWRIDRSAWTGEHIQLTFNRMGRSEEPMMLVIPFQRQ